VGVFRGRNYILEEISKTKNNLRSNNLRDVVEEIIKLETYFSFLALRLYSYRFVHDIQSGNYNKPPIDKLCRALEESGLRVENIEEFLKILNDLQLRVDDLVRVSIEDCSKLISDVVVAAIEYLCGEVFRRR